VAGQRRRDPGGRRPRPRGSGHRLGADDMAGYSVSSGPEVGLTITVRATSPTEFWR
jgi:hypothetical protein